MLYGTSDYEDQHQATNFYHGVLVIHIGIGIVAKNANFLRKKKSEVPPKNFKNLLRPLIGLSLCILSNVSNLFPFMIFYNAVFYHFFIFCSKSHCTGQKHFCFWWFGLCRKSFYFTHKSYNALNSYSRTEKA
jgi:hypothetical protein